MSALVKYLSNRAFHSRDWRRGRGCAAFGRTGGGWNRRRRERKGLATPRSVASLIFIRKISRGDGDDGADKVQSRFYCPLLEGGLSTFLCPAEIHGARKCLLKISTSVADPHRPAARPPSRRSVLLFQPLPPRSIFLLSLISVLRRNCRD